MSPHLDVPSTASSFNSSSSNEALKGGAVQTQMATYFSSITPANGANIKRQLLPGIYVPTVAFFQANEDVDLETTARHAVRLAEAGVTGITVQGSNGEAVHLSPKERALITLTTREALDNASFKHVPVMVGCGAQSTRETIELCQDAYRAGGDCALVLPPSYYSSLYGKEDVLQYFRDVADESPIPILIYNYPPAASGRDLSSDEIIELAKHPNIVGCKLTCGNTGKLNRIAAATQAASFSNLGSGFLCMGGSADFLLQTLIGGGSGIIAGLANISPKALVHLYDLVERERFTESRKIQAIVARGDWTAIQGGLVGTKSALNSFFGYGGFPRRPLPRPSKEEKLRWKEGFTELMKLENVL
ncbi:dihydrodipicolinate synthetase [Rhizodiscina lignyota]|uniref:Dihydrodipicolinate synthetase n=1 Tax=Rhizodiscina lignyota TaxID=1504668 RepID=A0A9P4I7I3_9PEZI|nr:dihydrodipicolinate synthetase [Rhizodiscina lignyota]